MQEVLDVAGIEATRSNLRRITARHIEVAVRGDLLLARYFQNQTFASAGIAPLVERSGFKI